MSTLTETFLGILVLLVTAIIVWFNKAGSTKVLVKRLHPKAVLPTKMTEGAAAFDLRCVIDPSEDFLTLDPTTGARNLDPGCKLILGTGLAFQIPEGYGMFILSRSGHGFKYSVTLANSVGLIDSDYRGEVLVCLRNDGAEVMYIESGERVAQAVIMKLPEVEFLGVDELTSTARSDKGLGSTGDN